MLVKVTVPLVHPVAVGAKVTVTPILSPGATATGRFTPDTLKSEPLALIAEIVALVCPVLVKTTSCACDVPTVIPPNPRLEGEQTNCCAAA